MKVIQFGEGNFLRSFVDLYLDTLNKEGLGSYEIYIVKPIPNGDLLKFKKQNNKYHVVLRGRANNKDIEEVYGVDAIKDTLNIFENSDNFFSLAVDKEVKLLISNTTEAGICFDNNDTLDNFPNVTYPAKLTIWLYKRFLSGCGGIYLLPVELIDNNADELLRCVERYIDLWKLGNEFKKWNRENNYYCNTLVDRIVSGYPKDEETKRHIFDLIGEEDELVSIGEPFGLWVVEDKGDIKNIIKDGHHNIDVVFSKDISYYKKRKVRVLNGSHTNMVPISLWLKKTYVYDAIDDPKLFKFIKDALDDEINPFVGEDLTATKLFSEAVIERFLNPFLNHQLTSIALNSISKWKVRVLCSFDDYYKKYKKIPTNLTIGFSYLIYLYSNIKKDHEKYIVSLPNRTIEMKDEIKYLEYFINGGTVASFLRDETIWGKDLTLYDELEATIMNNIERIKNGEKII